MAKTTALPEWIPVKERLPDGNQDVLIACGGYLTVAMLRNGEWWGEADLPYLPQTVTHWMPLPAMPPQGEKYRSPKRGEPVTFPLPHSKPPRGWVD
jgi:hypothetical protein